MTEINRQPLGLSDLLQVQAGGRNPDQLSQTLRGTLDLAPLYFVDRMRAERETFSLSVGQRDFIEIPEGQAWMCQFFSVNVDSFSSSTEQYNMSIGLERIPGQGFNGIELFAANLDPMSSQAGRQLVWAFQVPRPFLATSGQRLTILLADESQTGAVTGEFQVVYTLINI